MPFRLRLPLALLALSCSLTAQTAPTVGSGAPTPGIANDFVNAYFRGGFFRLVNSVPLANVAKYGTTGYFQEFSSLAASSTKLALITPGISASGAQGAVSQVAAGMYTYYSAVGVNVAGYPTADTQPCLNTANCLFQLFSNNYALFYYSSGNPNGNGISLSGNLYTLWTALGADSGPLGFAYQAQSTLTSNFKTAAIQQQFTGGLAFSPTSGINSGNTYAVLAPVLDLYTSLGGATGTLGLPTSNDAALPDGSHRQSFEGGRIVYIPGAAPVLQLTVGEIDLAPTGPLTLISGQTATASVSVFDTQGSAAMNRAVSWTTSNSQVVSIVANGYTAVLKAAASGTAQITATSEGLVSKKLTVFVTSICCQIGEGAPTSAIQQAFQDAVARSRLAVLLPAAAPVRRLATGYVQDLYSPDGLTHYLIAKSDLTVAAYSVTQATLSAYTALNGPAGFLGYPASDYTLPGRQLFLNGALAGDPVQTVTGPILTRWAALLYEAGPAGLPTAPQTPFVSASANTGFAQIFSGGVIYGVNGGALAGKANLVAGPILSLYMSLGGPAGELGIPIGAQLGTQLNGGRQNFENGYIALEPLPVEHLNPRTPTILATPASVLPGTRLHLAVAGFDNGAALRVSQTGQADFLVGAPTGNFSWDTYIPSNAAAGTVALKAVAGTVQAIGSYTVRSIASAQPQLLKTRGDNQTGAPGVPLAIPLSIQLTDGAGAPIAGAAVSFSPSPGASVSPAAAVTDGSGSAVTSLRLPAAAGIAAVTAQALGQVAIFNAQSVGSTALAGFPQFTSATAAGTPLAAAAAVLRYYQNSGAMPTANGLADVAALTRFLNSPPRVDFWALNRFTGGNVTVSVETPSLPTIRSYVAAGDPVILFLDTATAVVATGIAADGGILISDPSPVAPQTVLRAGVVSALRLLPRPPSPFGFVLQFFPPPAATMSAQSPAGPCGPVLTLPDASQFLYCDGTQGAYQLDIGSAPVTLTDFAVPSSPAQDLPPGSYSLTRVSGSLALTAPAVDFTADSVLNAASFQPGISPGEIVSIFGTGLANAAVTVGGLPAAVLIATPFQINALIPTTAQPAAQSLSVATAYGTASQTVTVQSAAPGIFPGGIFNQDATRNSETSLARRGDTLVIYCTGLGSAKAGPNSAPQVLMSGVVAAVSYAGPTPGFPGLYQVNTVIPAGLPPGLSVAIQIAIGPYVSNTVQAAIR